MPRPPRPANAMFIAVCNVFIGLSCSCCAGAILVGEAANKAGVLPAAPVPPPNGEQADADVDAPAAAQDPIEQALAEGEKQQAFIEKEVPHLISYQVTSNIAMLLASIALLISAIGLFALKSWSRLFCILGAGLMLLVTIGDVVYQMAFVLPACRKFDEKHPKIAKQPGDVDSTTVNGIRVGCLGFIGIGYPLLAMAVMMTSNVRHVYTGDHRDEEEQRYDRYQDDDDYDDRRRDDDWER